MFRRRVAPEKTAAAIADDIRATIARLDEQRAAAARMAGRALVNQAEVTRACALQVQVLADASATALDAQRLALRAAGTARHDADPELPAFEQTAAGLHSVQQALEIAAEPLRALDAAARHNVEQARQVLARAQQVFTEQVREQVRLLIALERAERARVARAHRP